ncbi:MULTISPECIES: DDE-type integrase/transposase/recombinase, partial [unclassified Fusobacterium]
KIYLCATLDLYDKSILSFSLSDKANTELVLKVLRNSFTSEKKERRILHSDRGKQFTSLEYKEALEELGIIHSNQELENVLTMVQWKDFLEI